MDIEKALLEKETSPLKTRTGRLPDIEVKKVKKEKASWKKSANTLLKPKLNFPKLKSDEAPQKRADSGEPWGVRSEILNQQAEYLSASSDSRLNCLCKEVKPLESLDFQLDPIAPEVIGISECQIEFRVPSSELISDDFENEEENLEESNALKRWKYWLKDKIHVQNVLSKKLRRNPCDLQIQESDKYREIFEDKLLLTYSQIPEPDKWRGHPFFWKERVRLGPRKMPEDCEIPPYEAVETRVDKGDLPEMEFIGIPKVVQKEKNPICKLENFSLGKWEKMPYRREQVYRFRKQRKKMKPYRDISMGELAVIGMKIKKEKEESKEFIKAQNVPEIVVTEENSHSLDFRQGIFCLTIDGAEIKYELGTKNCQNSDKVFTWQVDFGTNKIGTLVEKVLGVENRGTVAVAYDWISKKNEPKRNSDLMQPKFHEPWFFFNKNSGLFLPGQIYELKFYHRSEFSGVRKEVWYLKTKPPLGNNQKMGAIVLSAVTTEDFSCKKNAVESFLRKRVRDAAVKRALEVIFYKVFNPSEGLRQIEYRSLFNKKELFEYHNPKHYYHSSVAKELNELFDEIPFKNQTDWDFSLSTLIAMVRNSNKVREKNLLLQKIAINSRKLFRPNYLPVKKVDKHKMTYEILCKMVTLMEEDYNYIRNLLFEKKECTSIFSFKGEEMSEEEYTEAPVVFEIKPINYIFFRTMLHLKVHERLSEAIECIVGMIETKKLFEPWKRSPDLGWFVKPRRRN